MNVCCECGRAITSSFLIQNRKLEGKPNAEVRETAARAHAFRKVEEELQSWSVMPASEPWMGGGVQAAVPQVPLAGPFGFCN
jgi:hypothetical protein